MQTYLTTQAAAAWAARLANAEYIPLTATSPYTEMTDTLSGWAKSTDLDHEPDFLDSEISMLHAAGSAALNGRRVFLAVSSQALSKGRELLLRFASAGTPMVIVNLAPAEPSPLDLARHINFALAVRDAGPLQIHCYRHQELLDCILLAFRLAEHEDVRLPVLIHHCRAYGAAKSELLDLPNPTSVKQFVGAYLAVTSELQIGIPRKKDAPNETNNRLKNELQSAVRSTLPIYEELVHEYHDFFGRSYPAIEEYRCENADYVFVMMCSLSVNGHAAVDQLYDSGLHCGLLRLRLLRPCPEKQLENLLRGKKAVAVIEMEPPQQSGGTFHTELASVLRASGISPDLALSFVIGTAYPEPGTRDFFDMAAILRRAVKGSPPPPGRLRLPLHAETAAGRENADIDFDDPQASPSR